jgi:hypothetical protein
MCGGERDGYYLGFGEEWRRGGWRAGGEEEGSGKVVIWQMRGTITHSVK